MNVEVKSSSGITLSDVESRMLTSRRLFIAGKIDDQKACDFFQEILLLNQQSSSLPIDVMIDSDGGMINAGMLMYDAIQTSKAPVRTFCIGRACSMGAVLAVCGPAGRYILPHSKIVIHEPVVEDNISGGSSTIKTLSEKLIEEKKKLCEIYVKHTGRTAQEVEQVMSCTHIFDAKESITFGLADEIIGIGRILGDEV